MSLLTLQNVDVIFGPNPKSVFKMLDDGLDRESIKEKTNHLVAVHNASLSVKRGEIFVVMGLSGSGKSSLLRCMNGLNEATRGRVDLRDVQISGCSPQTLRSLRMERISMVFQRFALMPWRTIEDNVGFGLEVKGVPFEERIPIVQRNLEIVGLQKWAKHLPDQLSGGMQQRVGLARALATQAEILLMDEPFSALDPLIRAQLQNELLRLQSELKKTIVFVSHDLDEALRLGSRIAIMESGKIVQSGTALEILTKPANDYVRRFVASVEKHCPRCAQQAAA
jgi:glycine betaine/proline transport system ATP-binding protein